MLHMHENYDYIIAGAKAWNKYYCEAFNVPEDKILNYGLPRIDYLLSTKQNNRKRFFQENAELNNKKIILYAPTFRRNMESHWSKIIEAVDYEKFNLIIKNHPGQKTKEKVDIDGVYYFEDWRTVDLISVCDYLITDYSAVALEAAVLKKKTYYWVYDYDEYLENNGLNIDLYKEINGYIYKDIDRLIKAIDSDNGDAKVLEDYRNKYLPMDLGTSTNKITNLICKSM